MIQTKMLTDNSWMLMTPDNERIGLVTEQSGVFTVIVKGTKLVINSKQEINDFFGEDIFANKVEVGEKVEKVVYVKGYPVDIDEPFEQVHDLPLYTKSQTSDVLYSAGYYCLSFPKGWSAAFCPKFSTMTKYGYEGPFKTEKEMKFILAKLRRCQK